MPTPQIIAREPAPTQPSGDHADDTSTMVHETIKQRLGDFERNKLKLSGIEDDMTRTLANLGKLEARISNLNAPSPLMLSDELAEAVVANLRTRLSANDVTKSELPSTHFLL